MPDEAQVTTVNSAEIARLAGVGRAAVSNWRRRYPDFPGPAGGTDTSPTFDLGEVRAWLQKSSKLPGAPDPAARAESAWQLLEALRGDMEGADAIALVGAALLVAQASDDLDSLSDPELAARLRAEFGDGSLSLSLPPVHRFRSVLTRVVENLCKGGEPREAFERFYQRYLTSVSRQFFATPPELADLMVRLAGQDHGTVFDPACGSGSLLRTAGRSAEGAGAEGANTAGRSTEGIGTEGLNAAGRSAEGCILAGQEAAPDMARLAHVRLRLAGHSPEIRAGDSLRDDAFPAASADAVLANPPFNQRDWGRDELEFDPRWEYGLPAKADSELAWLQHALSHARPGGTVVLLLPPAVAFRGSGRQIRAALLRRGVLRAVIGLPTGAAPPMGIPLMLWVLRRPIEGESAPDQVLLVDAAAKRDAHERGAKPDWSAIHERVLGAYRAFADDPASPPTEPRRYRVLPVVELLDQDVNLTPSRYLHGAEPDAAHLDEAWETLARLSRDIPAMLPKVEPSASRHQAMVALGDLVRRGSLEIHQGRRDPSDIDPAADMLPSLTGADIARGSPPSGQMADDEHAVWLRPGDVLVPRLMRRPAALVVTDEEAVADANVYLLRPAPEVIAPWFLAGFVMGALSRSGSVSDHVRLADLRRMEVPRLPLADQRPYDSVFRRLWAFRSALREVAATGEDLWRGITDGLAAGTLRPDDEGPARSA